MIFRPASAIDEDRNSTAYDTFCVPGLFYGLELFQDVAVLEDHPQWLFVAYNAGVQVWDLRTSPQDPVRVITRDGWLGQFQIFPDWGEGDTYIETIAVAPSPSSTAIYVAVGGRSGHGLSIWRFTPETLGFEQIFQDAGRWFRDLDLVERNGRVYAFAADPSDSLGGVLVYDVTAADASPCFDDRWPTTCAAYVGHLGSIGDASYVDTLIADGELYAVVSDGSSQPGDPTAVEIWRVADPRYPQAEPVGDSVRAFAGLETNHRGVQLFEVDGRRLLATLYHDTAPTPDRTTLRIYDVGLCLDLDGCSTVGSPLWTSPLPRFEGKYQYLTVSTSGRRTFLYYGLETTAMHGSRVEQLFDVTGLSPTGNGKIVEVTETGSVYVDPLTALQVDYWGDYYGNNTHGLENLLPRHGVFLGSYFYRAAIGVLDVHRYQPPADLLIDGFEAGNCRAWNRAQSTGQSCR